MAWVVWRQHRAELLAAVLLLAAAAVPLLVTGLAMHGEYVADGVAACVADPRDGCGPIVDRFTTRYAEWDRRLAWAAVLPGLVGVFVGAPLLAREFESGTWKLAFTQSVTRTRWVLARCALVGLGAVAVAGAFAALFTWWRGPLDAIAGRLHTAAFVVAAPSLMAVTLFAFAVGVFLGALLRRTILAMAATLVAFATVRIFSEENLRPRYLAPRVRVTDPAIATGGTGGTPRRPATDWVVGTGWIDPAGHRLTEAQEWAVIREVYQGGEAVYGPGTPIERYLAEHGLRHVAEYHPASAFWTFQAIEATLYAGLAALLLVAATLIVRRRTT